MLCRRSGNVVSQSMKFIRRCIYINVGIPGESDILVRVVGTGWDSSSPESLARPEIGT